MGCALCGFVPVSFCNAARMHHEMKWRTVFLLKLAESIFVRTCKVDNSALSQEASCPHSFKMAPTKRSRVATLAVLLLIPVASLLLGTAKRRPPCGFVGPAAVSGLWRCRGGAGSRWHPL